MAGKHIAGDSFASNLLWMSKNQLYDIMSQMNSLIEQNQQQARQILVENPLLTKALFQAQIMLGMVQPPQVMPNIQQSPSQHPQQSVQTNQQLNIQTAHTLPIQVGPQDQRSASQTQTTVRKQQLNQPAVPVSSASVPLVTLQPNTMSPHSLQALQQSKGPLSAPLTPISLPQSSSLHNIPSLLLHSAPQLTPLLPPQIPNFSSQSQQSMQTAGFPHLPLQPPLLLQTRPSSMLSIPPFPNQLHSQMGLNLGFQPSGVTQPHLLQPTFHSGSKPPTTIDSSFPQGQPPLPPQSLYKTGSSHFVTDYSHAGNSMQVERGAAWMPTPPDNAAGVPLPGPPQLVPGHVGPGSQPPRPPQLSLEMEKALLQQVMNLTPEQINLLPPEQRHQVLQLQQMLR